jgi:hypothetical protein
MLVSITRPGYETRLSNDAHNKLSHHHPFGKTTNNKECYECNRQWVHTMLIRGYHYSDIWFNEESFKRESVFELLPRDLVGFGFIKRLLQMRSSTKNTWKSSLFHVSLNLLSYSYRYVHYNMLWHFTQKLCIMTIEKWMESEELVVLAYACFNHENLVKETRLSNAQNTWFIILASFD